MSTKSWIALSNQLCWRVTGRDARRYLHNRLSNDIRSLSVGGALEAAALSAQGRIELLVGVLCLTEDEFLLYCNGGGEPTERESLRAALARYVVADRVSFTEFDGRVFHLACSREEFEVSVALAPEWIVGAVARARVSKSGLDIIVKGEHAGECQDGLRAAFGEGLTEERYHRLRWEAGVPSFPEDINDRMGILECGLRHVVAFGKGCYVGQEVVERGDALGKAPRLLTRVLLTGRVPPEPGSAIVSSSGESLGKLVRALWSGEGERIYGFALLKAGSFKVKDRVLCAGLEGEVSGGTLS